jgi:hypothetical protein
VLRSKAPWRVALGLMGSVRVNCVLSAGLFWYHYGMAATATGARSVGELLGVIGDGGQAEYLLFWGHRAPGAGGWRCGHGLPEPVVAGFVHQ